MESVAPAIARPHARDEALQGPIAPRDAGHVAAYAGIYTTEPVVPAAAAHAAEPRPSGDALVTIFHDGAGRALVSCSALTISFPECAAPGVPVLIEVGALLERLAPGARLGTVLPVGEVELEHGPLTRKVLVVIAHALGLADLATGVALIDLSYLKRCDRVPSLQYELIRAAEARLEEGVTDPPAAEIEAVASHRLRHAVHRKLVRPIAAPLSSSLLRRRIVEYLRGAATVLDVSCGDDSLILQIADRGARCIANDAALGLMRSVARKDRSGRVIYTLQNLVEMPFIAKVDLAICKNTIHHLPPADREALFYGLDRLARRMLFIDIVDVKRFRRARIWNLYYRCFLGDQGAPQMSFEEFASSIRRAFPGRDVTFDAVDTVKGRYAFVEVSES